MSNLASCLTFVKVLDVDEMLSIQVHPTKEEAKKGFEREEAEGVPINAPIVITKIKTTNRK